MESHHAHLSDRTLGRVGGMGRVDHHIAAEFPSHGPSGSFEGVGGSQDFPDLSRRILSLVDEYHALHRTRFYHLLERTTRGALPTHEFDDLFELVVGVFVPETLDQLL